MTFWIITGIVIAAVFTVITLATILSCINAPSIEHFEDEGPQLDNDSEWDRSGLNGPEDDVS